MPPYKKKFKPNSGPAVENSKETSAELPTVSRKVNKTKVSNKKKQADERGVVFIKHLPHGFFEEQIRNYFEQFGDVTRLRLSRSKRSGGSKGYAFVEFAYPEVAQVAAETMDNYLMFNKIIKASYIPPDKQRFNYFKSSLRKVKNKAGKEIYVSSKTASIQRKVTQHNNWTNDAYQKRTLNKIKKVNKLKQKYSHLGIDFSKIVLESARAINQKGTAESASNSETTTSKTVDRKKKKAVVLADLLGSTINEDSDDETFIAENESGEEEEENDYTTDEEEYNDSEEEHDDDNEEVVQKNTKKNYGKSKQSNKDRLEHITKRKPHAGGIIKRKKIDIKKPAVSELKNSLKMKAVKEAAQPLSKFKNIKKKNTFKKT